MKSSRTVRVEVLRRVEGEGGLFVRLEGDEVVEARLDIFEPPRLFERLLVGKPLEEVPDITARICGICPVAYQMSTVHALEAALGIEISPEIRQLRRLLYCGEWIESHTLHIHLLNAPDFLGYADGIEMAADHPEEFQRGLRLRKHGNQLIEVLGGRAIHPVNVAVGGFYRIPDCQSLAALIPDFQWGLEAAIEVAHWVAGFEFPDFISDAPLVALVHDAEYPMNEGRLATPSGESIAVADYERHFREFQVAHSTALHCVSIPGDRPYLVGPLARVALNRERLLPRARQTADAIGLEPGCRNPFRSILARAIEIVQAYEEALGILQGFRPFPPARSYLPAAKRQRLRRDRSAARHALSPFGVRCDGTAHRRQDRAPHVAKPKPDRTRLEILFAALDRTRPTI